MNNWSADCEVKCSCCIYGWPCACEVVYKWYYKDTHSVLAVKHTLHSGVSKETCKLTIS